MILDFPSLEVVHLALSTDLIPQTAVAATVRFTTEDDGRVLVECSGKLSRDDLAELKLLGVPKRRLTAKRLTSEASCWPELLSLKSTSDREISDKTVVLFDLAAETGFADVVSEIFRLGNDRQSFRVVETDGEQRVFLRVIGPPYYSLLRALDRNGSATSPQAFVEQASRVWIELGYEHPLANSITPPIGQILLIARSGKWRYVPEGPFRDVYQSVDFQLPLKSTTVVSSELEQKLAIPLKLVRGGVADNPEFWVLTESAFDQLDSFVSNSDERLIQRLSFAIADNHGEETILLRVRPSKKLPPVLVLDALPCSQYLKLSNLFVPAGQRIHPPLRRDVVKQLLANDTSQTTWLTPLEDGSFAPHTISDTAFRPLADWVEYVLDKHHESLDHWVQSAQFDFESFDCPDEQPLFRDRSKDERPKNKRPEEEPQDDELEPPLEPTAPKTKAAKRKSAAKKKAPIVAKKKKSNELEKQLRELEQHYLAMKSPLEDQERLDVWIELSKANAELNLTSEAGICWGHVFWEDSQLEDLPELLQQWFHNESRVWDTAADFSENQVQNNVLKKTLSHKNPSPIAVNSVATWLIWQAAVGEPAKELVSQMGSVQHFLERHESMLSIRSTWLAWTAFSQLSNGDVLALGRARDRVLERLFRHGMTPDRDVPAFLRASGIRSGDRFRVVREEVLNLRGDVKEWCRKNKGVSAETTYEYVDMTFAIALARLGEVTIAREVFDEASQALGKLNDKVHSWFIEAYEYRVTQAIDGRPANDALPDKLANSLAEIRSSERFDGFKIDRLRENSRILEPIEILNPFERFHQRFRSDFVRQLSELSEIQDPVKLVTEVEQRLLKTKDVEQRILVVAKSLEVGPRLGETLAQEVLAEAIPMFEASENVIQQAHVLERGVFLAAHFDQKESVTLLIEQLHNLLESQVGSDAETIQELGSLLSESLKSMRKLGMQDNIARLLEQMENLAKSLDKAGSTTKKKSSKTDDAATEAQKVMLHTASGWFFFGQDENAWKIVDAGRDRLLKNNLLPVKQTQLASAYATALGQAPVQEATARFRDLFKRVRGVGDKFTTNTHFSLSQLIVVESVLLSMVSDEFTMSESGRRWLDDDEGRIRNRIHRDVRAAMSQE